MKISNKIAFFLEHAYFFEFYEQIIKKLNDNEYCADEQYASFAPPPICSKLHHTIKLRLARIPQPVQR